ncbi:hypothetical protein CEXT_654121 [Caerostris extrusa]|uniref:Uncharacterized protein n=1 Tax=Caerostris extrusa TaxID=172846 RepID=A0AAV4RY82_CAEEX|nr:hypothetical protein CEXT_654121 [Caerostris extrusa]
MFAWEKISPTKQTLFFFSSLKGFCARAAELYQSLEPFFLLFYSNYQREWGFEQLSIVFDLIIVLGLFTHPAPFSPPPPALSFHWNRKSKTASLKSDNAS